ncbi:unnamed protein product [marine sediment metagenome]|uniref:Uncharacterized protein n=1 Tax=marine sediment metagenome TaxID=412755 RepID=X0STS7_9ZZZZ
MKILDAASKVGNNPWLVVGTVAVAFWWMMQPSNDSKIPDEYEPVSVAEVNAKIAPVQRAANNSDYDMATKGISWSRNKLGVDGDDYTEEYLHEQLCGNKIKNIEGYYPIYQRVTGTKHVTEGSRCE